MIKYADYDIVFDEVPDEVTLAFSLSLCPNRCEGCHSPHLRGDIGEELTPQVVDKLIEDNYGVNCFLLLGEGRDKEALLGIAEHLRRAHPELERAVYSGRTEVEPEIYAAFDYVKVGPYVEAAGPLNSPSTNQRLYHHGEDITARFWHRGLEKQ